MYGSSIAGNTFCTWYQKHRWAGRLSHSPLLNGFGTPDGGAAVQESPHCVFGL